MMWPFRKQADATQELLDAFLELQTHINDQVAEAEAVEATRRIRRMLLVLRSHDEVPS